MTHRHRVRRGAAAVAFASLLACGGPDRPPRNAPEAGDALYLLLDGRRGQFARDIAIDAEGNAYVAGGTRSPDFPTTRGAVQTRLDDRGARVSDAFVTKLDPQGRVVWSTLLGGPEHDRAYAVALAPDGGVVIAGRAGEGFPVTEGALQTTFEGGVATDLYGAQDGFFAKLSADGSRVLFASYFGSEDGSIIRDVAVDRGGHPILAAGYQRGALPEAWFAGVVQPRPPGRGDGLVAKVSPDGRRVLWASFLGGSDQDTSTPSVAVGPDDSIYFLSASTRSTDLPTTAGAFDRSANGGIDLHVARLSPDGRRLLYGTYLGGGALEFSETQALAVAPDGSLYVGATTTSPDFPTTEGAYQRTFGGVGGRGAGGGTNYPGDAFVARLSPTGALLASTFLGGSAGEGLEGVAIAPDGDVVVSGATFSADFPTTPGAPGGNRGNADGFTARLSPDLSRLRFSATWGGSAEDAGRVAGVGPDGSLWSGGESASRYFGNVQRAFATGGAAVVVRFPPPGASSAPETSGRSEAPDADGR